MSSSGLGGLSPGAQCPWSWGAGGGGFQEAAGLSHPALSGGHTVSHSCGSAWVKDPCGSLARGLGHDPFTWSQGDKTFRSPKVALPGPARPWAGAVPSASCWSGRRLRSPSDHTRRSFCCFTTWRGCRAGALLGQGSGHPDPPWETSPALRSPSCACPPPVSLCSRCPARLAPPGQRHRAWSCRSLSWALLCRQAPPCRGGGGRRTPDSGGSVWGQGAGHFLASLPRYWVVGLGL